MTNYMCSETGDASGFRGCGRWFGSLAAFDRHWSRATTPDDADRDSCIVASTVEVAPPTPSSSIAESISATTWCGATFMRRPV